ncbi:MAG: SEC-C metal-binding domain-containing protein, partial [Lentisphaeria bacterium]|nr:SEC-C metal-binding domain-containing protein [Lentisphaeria bacterium]
ALESTRRTDGGRYDFIHRESTNMGFGDTSSSESGTAPRPDRQITASGGGSEDAPAARQPTVRSTPKVGRNEPCPCGSGKKYKRCHGRAE